MKKNIISITLAALIFFSPNFLFLMPFFSDNIAYFLVYDFVMIWLITAALSSSRFGAP